MPTPLDDIDAALVRALVKPLPDEGEGNLVTLAELAEVSGTSLTVLEALVRERLLLPREPGDPQNPERRPPRYASDDASVVEAGMALLQAGLPLAELLDLARRADEALLGLAEHAVDTFLHYVRDPVRGSATDPAAAADQLVTAFQTMLPATGQLVGGHFRRLVIAAARQRLGAVEGATESGPGGDAAGVGSPEDDPTDSPQR